MPYTAAQKRAYYAGKRAANKSGRPQVRGSGRYTYSKPGRSQVRGRGDYTVRKDFFSAPKIGSALGAASGAAIGNMIAPGIGTSMGSSIGAGLGKAAGQLFKSITGWGDYNVQQNSLVYPDAFVPSFGDDSIRVKHREYICDISASHDFQNLSIPLNPGLDESFPWLTAIARNYEQYRFNGMIFQFVSTSSDAIADTTNLGLGTVCMATDYNAADADFVNMPQALNSMFANSAKPSQTFMHAIECAPQDTPNKLYYVRTGAPPTGTDIRLYDLGKFQVSTQGMPADADYSAGQLWVTYDVTFCKSVMNNQLGYALNTDKWLLVDIDTNNMLGTSQQLAEYSNLGTTIGKYPGQAYVDTVYFPESLAAGYYLVNYSVTGTDGDVGTVSPDNLINCELVRAYVTNTQTSVNSGSSTGTVLMTQFIIKIKARKAYFSILGGSILSGSQNGDLVITQVNGEIYQDLETLETP